MRTRVLLCLLLAVALLAASCGRSDPFIATGLYPLAATQATLQPDDLSDGWEPTATDPGDADSTEEVLEPCGEAAADPFQHSLEEGNAQFARERRVLANTVGVFETLQGAEDSFSRYVEAFDGCEEWSTTNDDTITEFTVEAMEVPSLGDESAGYRLAGQVTLQQAASVAATLLAEIAVVRDQNVIVTVAQVTIGLLEAEAEIDTAETLNAFTAAHARVAAVDVVASGD